jgi:hypothetical protein
VRGGFRAWPRCVLGGMLSLLLRSRVRVFYCVARALQGCASASSHFALITHVALQVLFHAALCEVASPDGVVGREWCYVEVRLLARPIWSTTSSGSFVRMFVCMYVRQCSRACARARGVGLHVRMCWRGCANVNMQGRRWWPGFRGLGPWVVSKNDVSLRICLRTPTQGYCAPRVNYEEVRLRVANAFAEKNHELGEMIGVIQSLSKDVARATDALRSQCL